jgi:hypothetical protein
MRLILAEVTGDQELTYAKIKLAVSPPTAVTDDKGQFQLFARFPFFISEKNSPAGSEPPRRPRGFKTAAAPQRNPSPACR